MMRKRNDLMFDRLRKFKHVWNGHDAVQDEVKK